VKEVRDRPAYPFRAVMVDCARHYHSPETLRRIIRWCALGKVRYLQLHLTDDQNWMFPTAELAGVDRFNESGKPTYTRAQLRELIDFGLARGVTLIPEIDVPGHSSLLYKLDADTFRIQGSPTRSCVNFASPTVKRRLKGVFAEAADLFKEAPFIHLGGDEASFPNAAADPDVAREMRRIGASAEDVFVEFIGEMSREIVRLGKRPIVWEGFGPSARAKRTFPKEGIVVAWENAYYPADRLAADGYRLVNAGWDPLYVVNHYRSNSFTMVPEERLYAWNPLEFGHVMDPARKIDIGPNLEGALMCWWEGREWTAQRVLPVRIAALGARLWNPPSEINYPRFLERVLPELRRIGQEEFPVAVRREGNKVQTGKPVTFEPLTGAKASGTDFDLTGHEAVLLRTTSNQTQWLRGRSTNVVRHLALGASVSSDVFADREFPPSAVVDGISDQIDSFWLAYPTPATLTIDLGKAQEISRIQVVGFYATGDRTLYTLSVRASASDEWQRVGDYSQAPKVPTAAGNEHRFSPLFARFVQVRITGSDQFPPSLGRIHEVRVY
jgi:hexosaminidase